MKDSLENRPDLLPYVSLSKIGLSKELVDKLPQSFKEALVRGDITPLINASFSHMNGVVVDIPLKLQMVDNGKGGKLLMAYPVHKELVNSFSLYDDELSRLSKGEVMRKTIRTDERGKTAYIQLDPETKSILYSSRKHFEKRLADFEKINDIELGTEQKQKVRDGKPVELKVGGESVIVGADLREPQGFKLLQGNMQEWNIKKQMQYDEAHPEFLGLVLTDKNRWEYQQIVDRQSSERAIKLSQSNKESKSRDLKL